MQDVKPLCPYACPLTSRGPCLDPPQRPRTLTEAPAYLVWRPAAREEVPVIVAVQGDVQHTRVTIESLLGPVPVVHVLRGQAEPLSAKVPAMCRTHRLTASQGS